MRGLPDVPAATQLPPLRPCIFGTNRRKSEGRRMNVGFRSVHITSSPGSGRLLTFVVLVAAAFTSSTSAKAGGVGLPRFSNITFVVEPPGEVTVPRSANVLLPCAALRDGQPPEAMSWTVRGQLISILGGQPSRRIIHENGSLSITGFGTDEFAADDGLYRCIAEMRGSQENFIRVATPQIRLETATMPRFFAREPTNLAVALGTTAMFVCRMVSRPPAVYSWLRADGTEVRTSGERILVYPDDGVLEIRSVSSDDLGDYRCRASAALGSYRETRQSAAVRLASIRAGPADASAPPEFVMRPWDVSVREGGTATLFCAANSAAGSARRTAITWLKDGSTVDTAFDNEGRLSTVGSGSLRVTNATEADTGVYTCRADNSVDSVDADAVLTVLVPPRFITRPENVRTAAGRDVELACSVYGVPQPRVYWLKDSEELSAEADGAGSGVGSDYIRIVAGRGLRISGVTSDDAGAYQCVAESEAGRVHAIAQLIVLPDDEGAAGGVTADEMVSVSAGIATAGPTSSSGDGGRQYLRPRTLVAAAVTSGSVSLVWQPPDDGEVISYQVVTRDGSASSRVRTANVTTTAFSQASLRPNTLYTFRVYAVGAGGRRADESPAELQVRTLPELPVPASPSNFTAHALSPTEIRATWAPPASPPARGGASGGGSPVAGTPVRGYRVYYYARQQTGEQSINTSATEVRLDRLLIHTDYHIRVAAVNAAGEGVPTGELHVRTFSAVPGAPPRNVTVEATGATTVLVQWSPPPADRQNGVITGYKLRYKPRDRPSGGSASPSPTSPAAGSTITTDGDARSYEIGGLEHGETYVMRLAATNVNGTGEYTSWIAVQTYDSDSDESVAPGKPQYIQLRPFTTEMVVSWAPPTGNVLIRSYQLCYGTIVPDERCIDLPATDRMHTIRDLRPAQSYVLQLRAHNVNGYGFPIMAQDYTRDPQSTSTASSGSAADGNNEGSPGELAPPLQVKAIVLSATTVLVSWHDTSLGPNQRVTDNRYYTIRYGPLTGAIRKAKLVNSTELGYIIDGLRPFTKYEFAVKVVRGNRESVFSLNQRNTTFEAAPASAPVDVTITASESGPNEVVVSWQPPIKANGRITNYVLYYATDSRQDIRHWVIETVLGDRLNRRVRPVTPDTTYFFRIEAHNSKGRGPMSLTEVFRTPKVDGTGGGGIAINRPQPPLSPDITPGKGRGSSSDSGGDSATGPQQPVKTTGSVGGLSQEIMWIIVGCVAGITIVAIVALVIVCRRRLASNSSGKRSGSSKSAAATSGDGSVAAGGVIVPQPPDLFKNHEQLPLKQRQLSSLDAAAVGSLRPGEELVPMLDPNRRSYDDDHRSVSVGADTFIDTYSSLGRTAGARAVMVTPQGLCREGVPPPRIAVQPMSVASASLDLGGGSRHGYTRSQYHQQYGSGARVHVGDSSSATPPPTHVRPPLYTAYPVGAYSGGYQSDNDSLKKASRSGALSTRSEAPSSLGGSRHERTLSSEQLSEDVVNLDGIMKELNTIKMQIES